MNPHTCITFAEYSNLADWGASSQFKMDVAVGKVSSGDPDDSFDDGTRRSLTPCEEQVRQCWRDSK